MRTNFSLILGAALLLSACGDPQSTPKPKGYFKIDFPEKKYVVYKSDCGFSFEVPDYAVVMPDEDAGKNPCWVNIYYKPFNATLHMSYQNLKQYSLSQLEADAIDMVYKHTIKAEEIQEFALNLPHVKGVVFELQGKTATPYSFYITDTLNHFLKASLYFNEYTNNDSTAPVVRFLKKDMEHLIESVDWKAR